MPDKIQVILSGGPFNGRQMETWDDNPVIAMGFTPRQPGPFWVGDPRSGFMDTTYHIVEYHETDEIYEGMVVYELRVRIHQGGIFMPPPQWMHDMYYRNRTRIVDPMSTQAMWPAAYRPDQEHRYRVEHAHQDESWKPTGYSYEDRDAAIRHARVLSLRPMIWGSTRVVDTESSQTISAHASGQNQWGEWRGESQ